MKRPRAVALAGVCGLALLGCPEDRGPSNPEEESPREDAGGEDAGGEAAPAADLVSVRGRVVLAGEAPDPYINPGGDAFETQCGFEGAFEISHVDVDEATGGLADVIVTVREPPRAAGDADRPPERVVINQEGCLFRPDTIVLRTGGTVELQNSDPAPHNFSWSAAQGDAEGSVVQPEGADPKDVSGFDSPGVYTFVCQLHPWMEGAVRALDHDAWAVTDAEGAFALELPPGEHELVLRHVARDEDVAVELTVPPEGLTDHEVSLELVNEE